MTREGNFFNATARLDMTLAIAVTLALPVAPLLAGDSLYVGIWYYLAVPAAALGLGLILRSPPFFLTGSVIASALTLTIYILLNRQQAEGLLVLGHLFSLPGAAAGLLLAGLVSKAKRSLPLSFCLGLFGLLIGFLLNQLVICNWVMWCGPLSWGPFS